MKRFAAMTLVLILTVLAVVPVAAAVPAVPPNRAVLDIAQLLSPATVEHLISGNDRLWDDTGGEIMFHTVHFVPLGQGINQYALEVFNDWGPGYPHNNGILVVISAQEADNRYWMITGDGIADYFTGSTINRYFDTYFYDHIVAGDYDMAVTTLFNALSDSIYRLTPPARQPVSIEPAGLMEMIPTIVIALIILWFVVSIMRGGRRRGGMMGPMMPRRRFMGGFWGGFLMGRGTANRQNHGGGVPPKPFGGGGGYTRGGGRGYSRGGGGGISRGGGRRR